MKLVTEPTTILNSMFKVEIDGKKTRFYRESSPHGDFYQKRCPDTRNLIMVEPELEKEFIKFFEKLDKDWKPLLKSLSNNTMY